MWSRVAVAYTCLMGSEVGWPRYSTVFTQGVDGGWAGKGFTTPRGQGVAVFLGVLFVAAWLGGGGELGDCGCWEVGRRHGTTIVRRGLGRKGRLSVWCSGPRRWLVWAVGTREAPPIRVGPLFSASEIQASALGELSSSACLCHGHRCCHVLLRLGRHGRPCLRHCGQRMR